MKQLTFEENRQAQINTLITFAEFCEKNNLRYFLACGTLLGAVRHKGYIPWDDDIDVWLLRPDYDEFVRVFREKNTNPEYSIAIPGDKNAKHSFIKLYNNTTIKIEDGIKYKNDYLGVDIDIRPLDGSPKDYNTYKKWYKKLKFHHLLFFARISSLKYGSFIRKMKVFILKSICGTKKQILAKQDKLHKKYSFANSEYIGAASCYFDSIKVRFKKEWFEEYILLDFEGKKFRAPKEYDKVLTAQYGDYMTLPPAEKQKPHQCNNVFWKE